MKIIAVEVQLFHADGRTYRHDEANSGQILIKFELSSHIFKKLKYKISRKSVQWEPSCSMRTDGHFFVTKKCLVVIV